MPWAGQLNLPVRRASKRRSCHCACVSCCFSWRVTSKQVGRCAEKRGPAAVFPAHWAPNGLAFYHGAGFPDRYRGGAFIAFHGSWNRAPEPQEGYNVVFQPMRDGKPSGEFEVFADGFAGARKEPGLAAHRPSGLAVGSDGALYITDDQARTVWRVQYGGEASAAR